MSLLRWTSMLAGMTLGYWLAGPLAGLAGLVLGWWLTRPRRRQTAKVEPIDRELAQAYRTLGLAPDASEMRVRTAYRRLMNRHHPDKLVAGGADDAELKAAQQTAFEVRRAYEVIRDRRR